MECAKAREKCTKGQPCSRCTARTLPCLYPDSQIQETVAQAAQFGEADFTRPDSPRFRNIGFTEEMELERSHADHTRGQFEDTSSPGDIPMTGVNVGEDAERDRLSNTRMPHTDSSDPRTRGRFEEIPPMNFGGPDTAPSHNAGVHQQGSRNKIDDRNDHQAPLLTSSLTVNLSHYPIIPLNGPNLSGYDYPASLDPSLLDFPINWLPANDNIDIDYSSILGLGISSADLFSDPLNLPSQLPDDGPNTFPPTAGPDIEVLRQPVSSTAAQAITSPCDTVSTVSHSSLVPSALNLQVGSTQRAQPALGYLVRFDSRSRRR